MPDNSYNSKIYTKQGGKEQVVSAGAMINVETGGAIVPNGAPLAAIAVPTDLPTTITAVTAIINALKALGITL
jgi:hypothetical protein